MLPRNDTCSWWKTSGLSTWPSKCLILGASQPCTGCCSWGPIPPPPSWLHDYQYEETRIAQEMRVETAYRGISSITYTAATRGIDQGSVSVSCPPPLFSLTCKRQEGREGPWELQEKAQQLSASTRKITPVKKELTVHCNSKGLVEELTGLFYESGGETILYDLLWKHIIGLEHTSLRYWKLTMNVSLCQKNIDTIEAGAEERIHLLSAPFWRYIPKVQLAWPSPALSQTVSFWAYQKPNPHPHPLKNQIKQQNKSEG